MLRAKASPPLIRSLDQAGYDFRIYAAAAQTFPAFRSTCWVDIEDSVFDDFPGRSPAERDAQGADEFARWLSQREDSKTPFRSEEHTSELQSRRNLVCRLLLEKKNKTHTRSPHVYL